MKNKLFLFPFACMIAAMFMFGFTPTQDERWPEIKGWPQASRIAAIEMWKKYGKPTEITPTMLLWNNNGSWKRTVIYNRESQHTFPVDHMDVLEQTINYNVPADKVALLTDFDGSITVHRTDGELSVKCDNEAANMLAINLANDIVTGKKTVAEARVMYANVIKDFVLNDKADEYLTAFQFNVPNGATNFKDKLGVTEDENDQITRKMKQKNERTLSEETGMR